MSNLNQILITGSTGNAGSSLLKFLDKLQISYFTASRKVGKSTERLLDFTDSSTYETALKDIGTIFLVRPPALANVEKYFRPFLEEAKKSGVQRIVFLSLQGAEKMSFVPHRKIELLIQELGFEYVFLRPSFFMQNLSTTHKADILVKHELRLPAGKGKTSFIHVDDIAEVASKVLQNPEKFQNAELELTGSKALDYFEVVDVLSSILGFQIKYKPINPIQFILKLRKEGLPLAQALVMTGIYSVARFGQAAHITDMVEQIIGKSPRNLEEFASEWKHDLKN